MISFILYECHSVNDDERLCSLSLKFTEKKSDSSHYGRIESMLFYNNPEINSDKLLRHINNQTWYKTPEGDYFMGVTHFSLPPCLQGHGLGPVIWSEFFNGLPDSIKGQLKISGSLNSGDAYTPLTDMDGKIIYETVNGLKRKKLFNQIERRNRFWSGMLTPINKTPPLSCDKSGNGSFKGFFKNPLPLSSDKIKLRLIKSESSPI